VGKEKVLYRNQMVGKRKVKAAPHLFTRFQKGKKGCNRGKKPDVSGSRRKKKKGKTRGGIEKRSSGRNEYGINSCQLGKKGKICRPGSGTNLLQHKLWYMHRKEGGRWVREFFWGFWTLTLEGEKTKVHGGGSSSTKWDLRSQGRRDQMR